MPSRKRDDGRIRGVSERSGGRRDEPSFRPRQEERARPEPRTPAPEPEEARRKRPRKPILPPPRPQAPRTPESEKRVARAAMITVTLAGAVVTVFIFWMNKRAEEQSAAEALLRATREQAHTEAMSVRGVVLREGGKHRVADVRVQLEDEAGRSVWTTTDGKGRFRFHVASGQSHEVSLVPFVVLNESEIPRVPARRGGPRVRLEMAPHTSLLLRSTFSKRLSGTIEVRVAGRTRGDTGTGMWDPRQAAGLVVGTVRREVYDVLLRHAESGRAGLLQGLRSGGSSTFATLDPAATVYGRLELPEGVRASAVDGVLTHHRLTLRVDLEPGGHFVLSDLPTGRPWHLSFHVTVDGERRQATKEIVPGEDDQVVLRLQ